MDYYYRTPIDNYFKGAGIDDLDQSRPPNGESTCHSVWDHFKADVEGKYNEGHIVLAITLTIHPTMKHNNRLLWDSSPEKQANALRAKIIESLKRYNKKYRRGVKAYFHFEATERGKIHCHGIMACLNDTSFYPLHIAEAMPCFLKSGFKTFGTKIERIKVFADWSAYCAKDMGKHHITPVYVLL